MGLKGVGPPSGHVLEWGDLHWPWYRDRLLASFDQGAPQLLLVGSRSDQIKMRVPEWPIFSLPVFIERKINAPNRDLNISLCQDIFQSPLEIDHRE